MDGTPGTVLTLGLGPNGLPGLVLTLGVGANSGVGNYFPTQYFSAGYFAPQFFPSGDAGELTGGPGFFARRYFPGTHFAPRYFSPVGDPPEPPAYSITIHKASRVLGSGLI